jgi:hypothetical protein
VGKKGDFVLLGRDPRLVELGYLNKEVEILETGVGGRDL